MQIKISSKNGVIILIFLANYSLIVCSEPIFGGRIISSSEIEDYPYIVSLQELKLNKNHNYYEYGHICGGILISEEWALTAGHCLHKKIITNLSVIIGAEIINKSILDLFPLERIELHNFNPYTSRNDIALVKFKHNLNFKVIYLPFHLPPEGIQANPNLLCKILGYGSTTYAGPIQNLLRKGYIKLMSNKDCATILGNIMAPHEGDNTICAMGNGQDSCQGDSGGPLICTYKKKEYLYGIVSQGLRCGGIPSIYTIVDKYSIWIKTIINE